MKQIPLFILFLFSVAVLAQENNKYAPPKFQKLDLKDGLTNLNVFSITQDDLGYIWIATARGLNRFDGTSFKYYLYDKGENSLFHDWVSRLHKNYEGKIFCSTRYGLNLFEPILDKMSRISSSKEYFYDFIDFDHNTYAVSDLKGLCVYNKEKKNFDKIANVDNDRLLNNFISDERTGIWAKSINNLGLAVAPLSASSLQTVDTATLVNYNPGTHTFSKFIIPDNDKNNTERVLVKIDNLIVIAGKRFHIFNLNTFTFNPFPKKWDNLNKIKDLEIMFIKQIESRILWIGTRTNGLYIFNLETNTLLNLNKSNSDLKSNWPTCLFKDRDNNIWVGTFDHGVNIAFKDRSNLNFDNTLNKLTFDKFITCITSDNNQNYYIGTRYDGFYIYNAANRTYKHFHEGNSFLTTNHIRTIFIDSNKKLWIASEKTLHITNLNVQKSIDFNIPGPNNGMVSFCEQGGKIIASSDTQGFFIFDSNGKLIKQEKKLWSNISQVIPFNKSEIIVSSYEFGIFIYNIESALSNNIHKSDNSENSNLNQPITMYLDSDNILWIGNYVSGLYKLNLKDNSFNSYTMEDGLPNNDIVGIVEDKFGKLWLSTSYGLSRFDKKKEFINYFYNEGLENLQFHAKAAYIDKEGTVFFGGNYGLNYFDPQAFSQTINISAPKIILENLNVQNKNITPNDETKILKTILNNTQEITLSHKQNIITIEYHAFDYIAADEIRYSYILEGLDKQWNNVGKRTYANFSNLIPGNYVFKVKAQNNSGIWSEVSSVKIEVKPSPFLTIQAFIIYFILLVVIIFISFRLILNAKLYKSRLELEHNERLRENEIAQMKMRFFANISHEIRTPLTLIKGNTDLLSNELAVKNIKASSLNGLRYSTERLLRLVNQLLSVKKLENDALDLNVKMDDIISITKNLSQSFIYVASGRNITLSIETSFDELIIPIDTDKYEKIISNLLSNSLKFAKQNGIIKIVIENPEPSEIGSFFSGNNNFRSIDFVKISVIDNGRGIPEKDLPNIFNRFMQSEINNDKPDYSGTGIGLNFTKRIIELHHGAIKAESIENVETRFSFVLSLVEKTYENDIWISSKQDYKKHIETKLSLSKNIDLKEKGQPVILLVEDDLELNRFLNISLNNRFKMISCYNGKEAIKLAQNQLPDLIISDIMMPEMDGLTLCKLIREDDLISHIPIILLTAKTDVENEIEGYEYGADDYISKPFEINVLTARINNLIHLRKKLQQSYKQGILNAQPLEITNQFELNFVKRIESIVSSEFQSSELNVIFLAEKMNMSRTSFYRKFMSVMDVSPKDFITKYRINKSIELIKSGNDNFGEISYLCGFGSQSNFSVLFKKEKGVSPLQFKKTL